MREYETFLDSELRSVRQLLNTADGVETRTNTTEILQEMFQENPGVTYTAAEAESEIRSRGWTTESGDPVNAVRAALARMKSSGEIESVGRGTFRLVVGTPDDPWGDPPEPEDPWAAAPASVGPAADDEPPF